MSDPRIQELQEWSKETGLPLPMPAEEIIELEDQGLIVDLKTGDTLVDLGNEGIVPCYEENPFPCTFTLMSRAYDSQKT